MLYKYLADTIWFFISFVILYLFTSRYLVPRVEKIQSTRARILSNNLILAQKNAHQITRLNTLIQEQKLSSEKNSKNRLRKLEYSMLASNVRRVDHLISSAKNRLTTSSNRASTNMRAISRAYCKQKNELINTIVEGLLATSNEPNKISSS